MALVAHNPWAVSVVLRHRVAVLAHERMFAYDARQTTKSIALARGSQVLVQFSRIVGFVW